MERMKRGSIITSIISSSGGGNSSGSGGGNSSGSGSGNSSGSSSSGRSSTVQT